MKQRHQLTLDGQLPSCPTQSSINHAGSGARRAGNGQNRVRRYLHPRVVKRLSDKQRRELAHVIAPEVKP